MTASTSTSGSAPSINSSAADTYHSATGSIGQLCIDMPPIDAAPSGYLTAEDTSDSAFRPLSLGLGPAKSPSQDTFSKILGGLRKTTSRDTDIDLEAANSSVYASSSARSYSSDALSHSSSQTSMDIEANTSIGKANIVPAASVPPLPPMPLSLLKQAEDKTPQAKSTEVFADGADLAEADAEVLRKPRKRASTLGALDRPKLTMLTSCILALHPCRLGWHVGQDRRAYDQCRARPSPTRWTDEAQGQVERSPPSSTQESQKPQPGRDELYECLPPHFDPDPPMDGAHLSPGLGADSPILAQLSPKILGNSPSLSPKPSFADNLKARLSLKSLTSSPGLGSRSSTPRLSTINQFPKPTGNGQTFGQSEEGTEVVDQAVNAAETTPKLTSSKSGKVKQVASEAVRPATSPMLGQPDQEAGLGFSPAILFNGQEIEPTRPLRFKKPSSAGGRLGGSPASMYSPASPSPRLHAGGWGTTAADNDRANAASPSDALFSPLITDEATSPSGERIEFGTAMSPAAWTDADHTPLQETTNAFATPVAPQSPLLDMPSISARDSPQLDQATPRPNSSDAGALADIEDDLDYLSHRDSMLSVAASTISIMSNSTCMSDSVGEELDLAADRRAKLLASVQQNAVKAQVKEAKRDSHAANRYRKSQMSQMSQSSSLRNIPEELSGGVQTMGLGLFESEEEELEDDEEKENLEDSPQSASGGGIV